MNHDDIPLGKDVGYPEQYDPSLLFPVARQLKRDELGLKGSLPFHGSDFWNAYEMSWLNAKGKPQVAIGVFEFAHDTVNIIESKSFKLYLNSYNQTRFEHWEAVLESLQHDLSKAAEGTVSVQLFTLEQYRQQVAITEPESVLIDEIDVEVSNYDYQPSALMAQGEVVQESLQSDLLKSNCLITSQPDWATVLIDYRGPKIDRESLLKYLISFRNHNEFHEQCVERIFVDLMKYCQPQELTVYARYTRRGGLDINPFRTNTTAHKAQNIRLVRQ
ncbi:NADPH-dependent 7-cyano-7-deazaguanine reductase QueF [Kangiella geojedonensis]|uniref:NADPH-dependent 7-cyano-7-deazaguanine reductase n=1 Tax=Kangiella geojedonensis TaxID=914150 RepID=A0A0F6TRG6_9GAMM|nr:NADPH-dependent 7-cyano-7-deazaguanine reductase QueF [Kangiella geojedonensis]AKE52599.1 NADPH-dependent 7-cyano-7-deazaguanine reductase [Kangiella geojedonensis]